MEMFSPQIARGVRAAGGAIPIPHVRGPYVDSAMQRTAQPVYASQSSLKHGTEVLHTA